MAVRAGKQRQWHTNLTVLPRLSGECVDNFVSQQSIAKETSIRGYKFFLGNYIHDVQGTLMRYASRHSVGYIQLYRHRLIRPRIYLDSGGGLAIHCTLWE